MVRVAAQRAVPVTANAILRATIHYSGHVQGVGFRYSVLQIARGHDVTGVVQNLLDGRVLLVAEGEPNEVESFVASIADRMSGFIRKTERSDQSGARQHRGFTIQ